MNGDFNEMSDQEENDFRSQNEQLNKDITIINQLSKNNQFLEHEITSFLNSFEQIIGRPVRNLSEANSMFKHSLEKIDHKLKEITKENKILKREFEKSKKIDHQSLQYKKIISKLQKSNRTIQHQNHELMNENQMLHREIDSNLKSNFDQEIPKTYQNQPSSNNLTSNNLTLEFGKLSANYNILKIKCNEVNKDFQKAQSKIEDQKNEILNLNKEKLDLQNEKEKIAKNLQQAHDKINEKDKLIDSLNNEIKELKKSNKIIQKEKNELETNLASEKLKSRNLQLVISDAEKKFKQIPVPTETISTKSEVQIEIASQEFSEATKQFENVINQQADEIKELYFIRNQLITKLQHFDSLIDESIHRNEQLKLENSELSHKFDKLSSSVNETHNLEKQLLDSSIDEILEKTPSELFDKIKSLKNEPINVAIQKLAQILLDYNKEVNHSEQLTSFNNTIEKLNKEKKALISHLQNALKFIREQAGETKNSNQRNIILSQCARLGRYIDDATVNFQIESSNSTPSVFNPSDLKDPQKIAQMLFDFINEKEMKQHPYIEIFTLLCCVTQISCIILDQMETIQLESRSHYEDLTRQTEESVILLKEITDFCHRFNIINENQDEEESNSEFANIHVIEELSNKAHCLMKLYENLHENKQNFDGIKKQDDQFLDEISSLKKEIEDIKASNSQEKDQFCNLAEKMVNQLHNQINEQEINHQTEIKELSNQLEKANEDIVYLKESNEEEIKHLQNKVLHKNKSINELQKKLQEKSKQLDQGQEELQTLRKDSQLKIGKLMNDIQTIKEEKEELNKLITKLQNSESKLKQKLSEARTDNAQNLETIKKQANDLDSKYDSKITELENELQDTKNKAENYKKEIDDFSELKQRLIQQNSKLSASERSLKFRLDSANDFIKNQRQANEAKLLSTSNILKQKYESHINFLISKLNNCIKAISTQLENVYSVNVSPDTPSELLSSTLLNEIDKYLKSNSHFILVDAAKARKLLGISTEQSISEAILTTIKETEISHNELIEAQKALELEKRKSNFALNQSSKLSNEKEEAQEWLRWATSIYRQASDTIITATKPSDVRMKVEEIILTSLSNRETLRKMEILRAEKKLLSGPKATFLNSLSRKSNRIIQNHDITLRSLMLLAIYSKRLQKLAGASHTHYCSTQAARVSHRSTKPIVMIE